MSSSPKYAWSASTRNPLSKEAYFGDDPSWYSHTSHRPACHCCGVCHCESGYKEKALDPMRASWPLVKRHYGIEKDYPRGLAGVQLKERLPDGRNKLSDTFNCAAPECQVWSVVQLYDQLDKVDKERVRDKSEFQRTLQLRDLKIERLQAELDESRKTVKGFNKLSNDLTDELQSAKDKIEHQKSIQSEMLSLKAESNRIYEHCEHLSSELHNALKQLKEAREAHRDCGNLSVEIDRLSRELETGHRLQDSYRHDLQRLREDLNVSEKNHRTTRVEVERLEEELRRCQADKRDCLATIDNLSAQLSSSQADQRMSTTRISDLHDELARAQVKHRVLQERSDGLQMQLANLEVEHSRCKQMEQELSKLQDERYEQRIRSKANARLVNMKPYLGIVFVAEPRDGTLLKEVRRGHPAWEGGLRPGDVVTRVGSTWTRTKPEFYAALFGVRPGDTMKVEVYRESTGVRRNFSVKMGAVGYPMEEVMALRRLASGGSARDPSFHEDVRMSGLRKFPDTHPSVV